MQNKTRLWVRFGVAATVATGALVAARLVGASGEGGEGGEQDAKNAKDTADADAAANGFHGDLAAAMAKIFAGEGGEGGIGMSTMWPRISAPALTDRQIRTLVTGNTVRSTDHHALHFTAAGKVEGWYVTWSKGADAKECPVKEVSGDDFYREGAECYTKKAVPVAGTWAAEHHRLCLRANWKQGESVPCWYVALLLDEVALFDEDGALDGKGNNLRPGRALGQAPE